MAVTASKRDTGNFLAVGCRSIRSLNAHCQPGYNCALRRQAGLAQRRGPSPFTLIAWLMVHWRRRMPTCHRASSCDRPNVDTDDRRHFPPWRDREAAPREGGLAARCSRRHLSRPSARCPEGRSAVQRLLARTRNARSVPCRLATWSSRSRRSRAPSTSGPPSRAMPLRQPRGPRLAGPDLHRLASSALSAQATSTRRRPSSVSRCPRLLSPRLPRLGPQALTIARAFSQGA